MSEPSRATSPRFLICCDWGSEVDKRAVYVADTLARTIRMGGPTPLADARGQAWSVETTLALARELRAEGSALLAFDAPLGLPASYLEAVRRRPRWSAVTSFVEWLPLACSAPSFTENVRVPEEWSVERPFVHVPAGTGSLQRIRARASRDGIVLKRRIEELTRGNPVFVTAGIPGSVGAAARDLWRGLTAALEDPDRDFGVWPFEGTLEQILGAHGLAVGEIYPRAAYAIALTNEAPQHRAPLSLAKTQQEIREAAMDQLLAAGWTRQIDFDPEGLAHARGDEDAFDALLTAAALLRCVLERTPLSAPALEDAVAEGGILGTGSVNVELKERRFQGSGPQGPVVARTPTWPRPPRIPMGGHAVPSARRPQGAFCPIPGCEHRYMIGRGGWDSHVGTTKRHPDWEPEVRDAEDRKRRFKEAFPDFFRTDAA